jgi:hypothetical protein
MRGSSFTRRQALAAYGLLLGRSALLRAQQPQAPQLIGEPPGRIPPPSELVNAFEFGLMAQRKLDSATYAEVADCDRAPIDRITFNPRMMVNTTKLYLSATLFGDNLFAPMLIGPIAEQKRFHPDGELAMVRGASAAKNCVGGGGPFELSGGPDCERNHGSSLVSGLSGQRCAGCAEPRCPGR